VLTVWFVDNDEWWWALISHVLVTTTLMWQLFLQWQLRPHTCFDYKDSYMGITRAVTAAW